uniref:17.8 kDa class I heat shock protein-like n=2 Tax=Nicotiana TaxID=4085 RepID=A0A1S3WXB7_TOBAC|nr:PREDICTED: 17.8 kDa class I heat shock protein-like [Nicotiana sylvestris]XP_016432259.1 PREDICTED: 17.8 kDa class I heat shock protein-like [Nicotiana tabacum]
METEDGALEGYFEPSCEWQHEEGFDVLLVHLPKFKDKEGLKVQISNFGVLKISGDRQVLNRTRIRFVKEIPVSKDHNTDEIKAKFEKGVLKITLPKKVTAASTNRSLHKEEYKATTSMEMEVGKQISKNSRLRKFKKVAISIAAIALVASALSGFAYYIYRSTIVED